MSGAGVDAARVRAAVLVGAGIVAALNIGKLPPALPALQDEFGLTLLQVSWMVALFLFGATALGMAGGWIADRFGPRRVMVAGLLVLGVGGALGAWAPLAGVLFASRMIESVGFLLVVLPGPALMRRSVHGESLRAWLGVWAAFMPAGTSLALLCTPWLMDWAGWRTAWIASAVLAFAAALTIVATQPADSSRSSASVSTAASARATLRTSGVWLLAVCFLFYAGQFLSVLSFLPSVYREAGLPLQRGALLTAIVVAVNIVGNLGAGFLLQRGWARSTLIGFAGIVMAVSAWAAFGSALPFAWRYAAVLAFSTVGGLVPGTLFATVPFYAPSAAAVSTSVGLMQQGSGVGQMLIPPAVAALAQYTGSWSHTWIVTGAAAMITVVVAWMVAMHDRRPRRVVGEHA